MRIGSLFAGIGGFDLAARWMGWETAWVSEIDPYASAVLKKHWPNAPNLGDITKIISPPPVDILVGGFPCQDISVAGKGEGIGGARSGLWKHYARIIGEIRPRFVVAENVSALRTRGLDTVLQDLAALGYDAEFHCIPASYVGAPHRRDRIWIVAYPAGLLGNGRIVYGAGNQQGSPSVSQSGNGSDSQDVAHSSVIGRGEECQDARGVRQRDRAEGHLWRGPELGGWWLTEPNVGRVAHGVPSRVDRLKCCGNAIVPQVAYTIFQAIARAE